MGRTFIGNFKGPKGDTGEQGPQGIQGPQGPQGESGEIDGNSVIEYVESTDDNPPASPGVIKNILGWLIGKMKKVSAQNNDLAQRLEGKAPSSHTHTSAQITDIAQAAVNYANSAGSANAVAWNNVSGKPSSYTPGSHTHTKAQITDLSSASVNYANSAGSANAVAWGNVSGKPSSYTPSSHTHDDRYYTESEVNSLLNQRVPSSMIVKTSKVMNISGNYVDVSFSHIGLQNNANYFISVQNANRAANDATVIGVTLLNQPPTSFRVYFDKSNVGNIQLNFLAIQI